MTVLSEKRRKDVIVGISAVTLATTLLAISLLPSNVHGGWGEEVALGVLVMMWAAAMWFRGWYLVFVMPIALYLAYVRGIG